jgi:ligand-binding SRPBCC domain-containing protein
VKVHLLERRQTVAAPLDEVFPFFARPENLAEITPPGMAFRVLTPTPIAMKEGAVIDYVVRVGGLPVRWRTLITAYEPPYRFVDEQILGPYSFWHHTHTFRPSSGGGTELGDVVRYTLPLGPIGELAHALMVRRQLEGIFAHRRRVMDERFGAVEESA